MDISGVDRIQIKQQTGEKSVNFLESKTNIKASINQKSSVTWKQSNEELTHNIEEMLKFFETNSSVKFHYDKSINRIIIQVVNDGNNETIKQIPPERILRFLKAFNEFIGILVDKEI